MANLRTLKKDISYLIEEVLSDCWTVIYFHPERRDAVIKIMQQAVQEHNDLFNLVNNPPAKGGALAKKHYSAIRRDLFDKADALFSELSATHK